MRSVLTLLTALATIASCGSTADPPGGASCRETHCLLFVGGSLTYWNDMPGMVEALVDSGRFGTIRVGGVFVAGSTLREIWDAGAARREIATGAWDVVALEQGPSSRPDSRIELRSIAATYATAIRAAGATPALMMSWPRRENIADFPASGESWRLAADDVHGMLFPVGDAWRIAWTRDASLALYGEDGWHPTVEASYLQALVVVGRLYGRSTAGLPSRIRLKSGALVDIDPTVAALLQQSADAAVSASPAPGEGSTVIPEIP